MKPSEGRSDDREVLRALFTEWAQGDFHGTDAFDENVDWIWPGIEAGSTHGLENLTESWRAWLQEWDDFRIEAEEIVVASEGRYVVMQVFRGVGRASGVETEGRTAVLVTMRDGKIIRMQGFWDRDEALRAAGVGGPR